MSTATVWLLAQVLPHVELEALRPRSIAPEHWQLIIRLATAVLTLVVAWVLTKLVPVLERLVYRVGGKYEPKTDASESTLSARQRLATLTRVTSSIAHAVIWSFAAISLLGDFGIAVGPLLATAGVAGVAIGFGAQSIVKDFFGGFFILLENQYDVGDSVTIGGITGTVERMSMRITVLRDATGTLHFFPNSAIGTVANKTQGWSRVVVDAVFSRNVKEDEARQVLLAAASRASGDLRGSHHLLEEVVVEGPVEFAAAALTWRLVARSRALFGTEAREQMILALSAEARDRGFRPVDGVLAKG